MSAIAIEFRRDDAPASIESANRMRDALAMFGSDRKAATAEGSFACAWVQSAGFTDQDRFERQPVEARDRWQLLFLGRLGHREELAEKLGIDSAALAAMPDCELAIHAWCKWAEHCREHLFGSYVVIVADRQDKRIIALRSHERSQHLYYYCDADRAVLSTSTKAIFSFPDIPRELDELKVADSLVQNFEDAGRSYFRNVSVLGHDSTLTIGNVGEPQTRFNDFLKDVAPLRLARDDDYVEQARELFDAALAGLHRYGGDPAISLSGGLDSTAIAVGLIEQMRSRGAAGSGSLATYTGIPEPSWDGAVRKNRTGDESAAVKALAAMYPELAPQFVDAKGDAFDRRIDMIQSYSDMPLGGVGNSVWGFAVREQARRDGVKTLVTGTAGNGNISFAAARILFAHWFKTGRWAKLAREARMFSHNTPGTSIANVMRHAVMTVLPDAPYDLYMRARGHGFADGFRHYSAIRPDFAADLGLEQRMKDLAWDDRFRAVPDRKAHMRFMFQSGPRNDSAGLIEPSRVLNGVQSISVLEDRKLMAFCYAIPDDQFYRNGVDRRLIRRMMHGKLPSEVANAKRGEQGSDWHSRRTRDLPRIQEELDRLADVPSVAQRIDIPRLQAIIDSWPAATPTDPRAYPEYMIARVGMGRAIAMARFINHVEGRN